MEKGGAGGGEGGEDWPESRHSRDLGPLEFLFAVLAYP